MKKEELLKLEEQIKNNAADIKEILGAVKTNSSNIERNSLALDILKDYKKERDRAYVVILILLVIIVMLSSIVIYHHWAI
jgi:hypothetical protein